VVAEVKAAEPHPDADRLRVCTVDDGGGELLTVVCGAPNVRAGARYPLARSGTRLPDGKKIRRSKIRGIESNGMLCSPIEIGLGEDADGILELAADAPIGMDLRVHLQLDDTVIDVDLTPNRGDCLGLAGIAREVGVLNRAPVTPPEVKPVEPTIPDVFPIHLEAPIDCPRYIGRIIRGIDPGAPTPVWMRERLRRSGVRSISAVVDVTNYVMLELGQPMHAFDLALLDREIRVRRACTDERLVLLDGTELRLDEGALVIADASRAVALAGIMGGEHSGVGDDTRDVLLECAWFHPRTVAVEARRRGLHTDASHRYERGVSTDLQRLATERATALLVAIAGGSPGPLNEAVDERTVPTPAVIRLRASRIERMIGEPVGETEVVDILERLGMSVQAESDAGNDGTAWTVTAPPFRSDVTIEADLIEELARVRGYDRVPEITPSGRLDVSPLPEGRLSVERVRDRLVERGYQEAITYSFVEPELQSTLFPDARSWPLGNPMSSEMSTMRVSTWPGLLGALRNNVNRQIERVRLFETGLVFFEEDGALRQVERIGGVVMGTVAPQQWGLGAAPADFFDVKADVEALLASGDGLAFAAESHPALQPGQSARVTRDGDPIGWIGGIHPAVVRDWRLPGPVFVFELDLDAVRASATPRHTPVSRYPAVRRDLALVVDEAVSAAAVQACIAQAGLAVLKKFEFFDVYRGEGIDSGRKSLALGLTFQDASRTLGDADVDTCIETIVGRLRDELGADLRG
ncbi:MAG: phenylalanine--tRNA ligase subunit beta, partial [Chromatiales bacterium]|nr:phenylalanine--tRNA ligase subunit beta [Chromatiales bacterium]